MNSIALLLAGMPKSFCQGGCGLRRRGRGQSGRRSQEALWVIRSSRCLARAHGNGPFRVGWVGDPN